MAPKRQYPQSSLWVNSKIEPQKRHENELLRDLTLPSLYNISSLFLRVETCKVNENLSAINRHY